MKIFNSPAQARALREVEAAAYASTKNIREINADIQPVSTASEKEKNTNETEAKTKETAQKTRGKKKE